MIARSRNGSAMVELVFLMMAAAGVIHVMLHWNRKFSVFESRRAGAIFEAHRRVAHAACLEDVSPNPDNTKVVIIRRGERICGN